jgi:hypothetical protein
MRVICTLMLGCVLFIIVVMLLGQNVAPTPPTETPEDYGRSTEPAIVDCARTYGVRQDTTEPNIREALVRCVSTRRKLGY